MMLTSNNPGRSGVMHDPRYNKGTAFSLAEREALGIAGLLPEGVDTLEIQVARAHTQLAALSEDLQKYLFLSDLQNRNLTLFYALLMSDPAIFMPLPPAAPTRISPPDSWLLLHDIPLTRGDR